MIKDYCIVLLLDKSLRSVKPKAMTRCTYIARITKKKNKEGKFALPDNKM